IVYGLICVWDATSTISGLVTGSLILLLLNLYVFACGLPAIGWNCCFFIARQLHIRHPFPWGKIVEHTEILLKLHGLIHHAAKRFIVTKFNKPCEWEIFTKRVTFKTIVGQNAAKVWVAGEINSIHIPRF